MNFLAWLASTHTWLVHVPVAAAVLVSMPILAAQRGGRGIRPWWTTCRFLAWAGSIGALVAVLSGLLMARRLGLSIADLGTTALPGLPTWFRIHVLGGVTCLCSGLACLLSLYRKRKDHQGIGLLALLFGLLWGGSALVTSYEGMFLHGRAPALIPSAFAPGSVPEAISPLPPGLPAASQLPGRHR